MRCITYNVKQDENNLTVEKFLKKRGISKHIIRILKQYDNGITLNNNLIRTIDKVYVGDNIKICLIEKETKQNIIEKDIELDIVYEDEDIMIISKNAGIAVHPSQGNRDNTIANALVYKMKKQNKDFVFRIIGRLDKNTSGLLVVAKNLICASILSKMLNEKKMKREYIAICEGKVPQSGVIDNFIKRDEHSTIKRIVSQDIGDRAITNFRNVFYKDGFSLVHIWLETGRTHQIRVHMNYIGYPLVGDFLYNPESLIIKRHALHAAFLEIIHPITNEKMSFFSPLPDDMAKIFQNLNNKMIFELCKKRLGDIK